MPEKIEDIENKIDTPSAPDSPEDQESVDQEQIKAGEKELEKMKDASPEISEEIEKFNQEMETIENEADQAIEKDPNKKRGRMKAALAAISFMMLMHFSAPPPAEAKSFSLKSITRSLKDIKRVGKELGKIAKIGGEIAGAVGGVYEKGKKKYEEDQSGGQQEESPSQPDDDKEQER